MGAHLFKVNMDAHLFKVNMDDNPFASHLATWLDKFSNGDLCKASVFQYLFTNNTHENRNIIPLLASIKSPISCSTDFETGCKPVWFFFITYSFLLIFILFLLDIFVFLVSLFCLFFQNVFDIRIILLGKIISLTG